MHLELPPASPAHQLLALTPDQVPVLAASRAAIAHWRGQPDAVDASRLADVALADPLLCLRVLAHVAATYGHRLANPVQSVTSALVLLGIEPFFRAFGGHLPILEERLADEPAGLAGAMAAIELAHAAARIAAVFAVHRQDADAELLHQAALLHDLGGILLWCQAPQAAATILGLLQRRTGMRTVEAQRSVLGCDLESVGQAMLQHWGLDAQLRAVAQARAEHSPGAQTVQLAVRIARHLPLGWQHPALAEDFRVAGPLLNLPAAGVAALVGSALR